MTTIPLLVIVLLHYNIQYTMISLYDYIRDNKNTKTHGKCYG